MTKASSKGRNLHDKLDCKDLDLSLRDLNELPVKELAAHPKATILYLSCNKLTTLPSAVPADFSRLVNLQHLDFLNNRLVTFAQLKNLKWLDLKDKSLNPVLAKMAGDCLDVKQQLVACRVTELLQQPFCISVNTIYDNAVQGLHHHEILQWVFQTNSQHGACSQNLLSPSLGAWIPMKLSSAGRNLFLASDLPAIIKWLQIGT
uniref:Leucine rich repeat containing 59 n=1 Tax=Cebus imitator TaxID=2715852 RepID=A0A2K5QSQ3_CEBIM